MNRIQKNQYERTGRVIAFLRQHPDLFTLAGAPTLKAAVPVAEHSLLTRLVALQADMEQTGAAQDDGITRTQSAMAATLRRGAIDRLTKIRRGAETVAFQRGTPEILRQFVIGTPRSEAAIQGRMLAVAGAIETLGMEAELGEALLQPDVLPSLRGFIAEFQKGRDARKGALLKRVRATSGIGTLISKVRRLVRNAEAIVKNRLSPGDERYAAWQSAARIPRSAAKAPAASSGTPTAQAQPQAPSPAVALAKAPAAAAAAPDSVLPRETRPVPAATAAPNATTLLPAADDGASANGRAPALN
jgi:hypothetical protein